MSLRDTACYTLTISPSASSAGVTELLESLDIAASTPRARYARLREKREGEAYSSVIYGRSLMPFVHVVSHRSAFLHNGLFPAAYPASFSALLYALSPSDSSLPSTYPLFSSCKRSLLHQQNRSAQF